MSMGEIEAKDTYLGAMVMEKNGPLANILTLTVYMGFIFMILMVLMNLLNGLAVSDTGLIRDEAEVVGWTSRVEHITYTESILLGDPFYFLSNWPPIKLIQRIPSCAVCRF